MTKFNYFDLDCKLSHLRCDGTRYSKQGSRQFYFSVYFVYLISGSLPLLHSVKVCVSGSFLLSVVIRVPASNKYMLPILTLSLLLRIVDFPHDAINVMTCVDQVIKSTEKM